MFTVIVNIGGTLIVVGNDYTAENAAMFRARWESDGYSAVVIPTGPGPHDAT